VHACPLVALLHSVLPKERARTSHGRCLLVTAHGERIPASTRVRQLPDVASSWIVYTCGRSSDHCTPATHSLITLVGTYHPSTRSSAQHTLPTRSSDHAISVYALAHPLNRVEHVHVPTHPFTCHPCWQLPSTHGITRAPAHELTCVLTWMLSRLANTCSLTHADPLNCVRPTAFRTFTHPLKPARILMRPPTCSPITSLKFSGPTDFLASTVT
jgi:hypothetical protein